MDKFEAMRKAHEELLNSERGKELIREFCEEKKFEDERFDKHVNRMVNFLTNYTGDLAELYKKYDDHNEKVREKLYYRGIDGESHLSSVILEAFSKIGVEVDDSMDSFSAGKYEWNGYIAQLFIGQGSFIRIRKKPVLITFENFEKHLCKEVNVQIYCKSGGMMYPERNVLLGMNSKTAYFVSIENDGSHEYWHWDYANDKQSDCEMEIYEI